MIRQRLGHPLDWRHDDRVKAKKLNLQFAAIASALVLDSPDIMEFTDRASFWLTRGQAT